MTAMSGSLVAVLLAFVALTCLAERVSGVHCDFNEFECDNGSCEPILSRCDAVDDCPDGSDEDDCSSVDTAVAVGASVAGIFGTVLPIALIGGIWYCVRSGRRTQVVVTAAPNPTTAVIATSTTQQTVASVHGGYPTQDAAPPYGAGYPPQAGYPPRAGYSHQEGYMYPLQQTAGYPTKEPQPPGYPPQEGYPPPQQGYPPQYPAY